MEKILIDGDRCTLCGMCIPVCVRRILEAGDDAVRVTHPALCILCGHCKAVCPEDAPQLPSLDSTEFAQAPGTQELPQPDHLMALFRSRRSTRNFKQAPVEKDLLEGIIQAGRFAPTGGNIQPVYFTVIHSKKKLDAIRSMTIDILVDQADKIEAAAKIHRESGEPLSAAYRFRQRHITRFREMPVLLKQGADRLFFGAPALIACHVNPDASSASLLDAGLASMQMVLMAEALGLGTCYIGAFVFATEVSAELKEDLQIPQAHNVAVSFVVGHPDVTFFRLVAREPAKIKWF